MAAFGSFVDGKLGEIEGKNKADTELKQQAVISRYVGDPSGKRTSGFSDPALMFNFQAQSGG